MLDICWVENSHPWYEIISFIYDGNICYKLWNKMWKNFMLKIYELSNVSGFKFKLSVRCEDINVSPCAIEECYWQRDVALICG